MNLKLKLSGSILVISGLLTTQVFGQSNSKPQALNPLFSSGQRCLPIALRKVPAYPGQATSQESCSVRTVVKGKSNEVKTFYWEVLTNQKWDVANLYSEGTLYRFTARKKKSLVDIEFRQVSEENTQIEFSFSGNNFP